ncbi:MAG: 1,4-alpha-glucan branching protein GlgB [Acidobacteriota bacterium]
MSVDQIEQIVAGTHGDPFAFLGFQVTPKCNVVRAWLPQAETAALIFSDEPITMAREHASGFFSAPAPSRDYRVRIQLYGGETLEFEDPYRFPPLLTDFELHLHGEGTNFESYRTMGAHVVECEGVSGVRFAVWAPNAKVVSLLGDFNGWDRTRHPLRRRDGGIWEMFMPGLGTGAAYKYSVMEDSGRAIDHCDPYGFFSELPPKTASIVWPLAGYEWADQSWMERRAESNLLKEPVSMYEVHLGSWRHHSDGTLLSYRELADQMVGHATKLGYTHLELMPVMEHPFTGSWGYQVTGYYAPTSRFGTPDDFRYFVDRCHQAGLGVILDWVPAHFPRDEHALARFDGTALYEHADPRKGEHRDWGTLIFNYGRHEVREFLLSNALYWLKEFHIDGLRVDAVASMLYLDYSREAGDWEPNQYGGRENLEAVDFLKRFNELTHQVPGAVTIAEESTSWPGVSRPTYLDGLGFTMKWNMGWMHDMLDYFSTDSLYRKYHQQKITFSMLYAFTENFLLPVSHDEVVYGKCSLVNKMPGDEWRKFANTRAFLTYMYGHPGRKLLFMGSEFGQTSEWNHDAELEWGLLKYPVHHKLQRLVGELNALYRNEPSLYEVDDSYSGFEWIDIYDTEKSIILFARFARDRRDFLVFCCNFTPQPREGYRVGLPEGGRYHELLNTDADLFGGSNIGNDGWVQAEDFEFQNRPASVLLTLPPLSVVVLKPER